MSLIGLLLSCNMFDKIINAVAANTERRKEIGNWALHDSLAVVNKVNLIGYGSSSNLG